ncbi:MAG: PspC domain-containing protein [Trueperaceae bacterium]
MQSNGARTAGPDHDLGHDHRRARRPQGVRRLTRSRRKLAGGVAAGVAEMVDADARLLRWIWALSLPLSGGLTGVAYLLLWALLPEQPEPRQS